MYELIVLEKAIKQLSKIPKKEADRIAKKIDSLRNGPFQSGYKKLTGYENVYRIRQGDYRILYEVKEEVLIIRVIKIGHRGDVYD